MLRQIIIFLFHLLFFLVPLTFLSSTDELFEFNKMIVTYFIVVWIGMLWITRMVLEKRLIFRRTPFDIPILLFLLSQIFSTLLSMHPYTSVFGYYSRFNGGLLSVISYITLFYAMVNNFKKEDVIALTRTFLATAVFASFYAALEHFGYSPSCFFITGKFDVACWVQDVQSRVFGTFGQPNWLAAYLIMVIPVSVSQFVTSMRSVIAKAGTTWSLLIPHMIPHLLMMMLFFATLLFTQSRSGLVGLGIGAVVYVVSILFFARQKAVSIRVLLPWFGITSVLLGLILGIFGSPYTPTFQVMLTKLRTTQIEKATEQPLEQQPTGGTQLEVGGTESSVIRQIVWEGAIGVWKRYPIFGSGVETFAYSYYGDRPMAHNLVSEWDFLYNKAHNEFLNYLATTGLLGLGSYLLLIGWVYVWIIRYGAQSPLWSAAWIAAFTGLHVSNFFGFSTVVVSTLFFLTPAFLLIWNDADNMELKTLKMRKEKGELRNPNGLFWIIAVFFIGFGCYLTLKVVHMWRADMLFAQGKQRMSQSNEPMLAIQSLQEAINIAPDEAIYHEEISLIAAQLAVATAQQEQSTVAGQLAEFAFNHSDEMMKLNPVHLNFYKSRARMLIVLSQLAPVLLNDALSVLEKAQTLAPTDPKIMYNRAVLLENLGKKEESIALLKRVLEMKPNYVNAQDQLKKLEEEILLKREYKDYNTLEPKSKQ
jgi:putative inorganic carbon (HCO3(-)) transporter